VRSGWRRRAVIASLEQAPAAMRGESAHASCRKSKQKPGLSQCWKGRVFSAGQLQDRHLDEGTRELLHHLILRLRLAVLDPDGEYNALPPEQRGSLAKAVFQYWFRNSAVLEALVQIRRTDILFDSLRRSSGLIQALQPMADDPAQFDYFVAIITSSMIGVLTVWVEHGKTETEKTSSGSPSRRAARP